MMFKSHLSLSHDIPLSSITRFGCVLLKLSSDMISVKNEFAMRPHGLMSMLPFWYIDCVMEVGEGG
jgi:hypothetical protein